MDLSKKEAKTLSRAITHWEEANIVSSVDADKLRRTYKITPFDWQRVAKYSFWIAISCALIAFSSILADEWLMSLFEKWFTAADSVKCIICTVLAGGAYLLGVKIKWLHPNKIYSREAIFFLGVTFSAASIYFLGQAIDIESSNFSLLLLLATVIYGLLGLWIPSTLVWLFSLISLGSWFGAETGYASGWGAYYLGMNYPLRFVLFGLVLICGGTYLFTVWKEKQQLLKVTRSVGLLYLFVALWLMSIFGNYGDQSSWEKVSQIELFHWSLIFAGAALGAIYYGVKHDEPMFRGYGLTFLFINLYTRFFELFWDDIHSAIFFSILALSFWYLGTKAEKIWQLTVKFNHEK